MTILGAAVALLITVIAGLVGNAVPRPWSSYVPMVAGDDFVRDEFVRQSPLLDTPRPCIAIFGDSRVAFNIEAAVLSTPECAAQNYGFAGFGLPQIKSVFGRFEQTHQFSVAVLGVNDVMIASSVRNHVIQPDIGQRLEKELRSRLMQTDLLRNSYLGHHRLSEFIRHKLFMTTALASGWTWDAGQRRWIYDSIERRELISLTSLAAETESMAKSYYYDKVVDDEKVALLRDLLGTLKMRAGVVVMLLHPSISEFQTAAEATAAGVRWQLFARLQAVAQAEGVHLIDCSPPDACDVTRDGFGDPIHLNGHGVKTYSQALTKRIASWR